MKNKTKQIAIHIFFCIAFLSLPVFFAPGPTIKALDITGNLQLQKEYIGYLLLVAFFYINFFVLIPKFYFSKKYFYFILSAFVCLIAVSFIPVALIPDQNHHGPDEFREMHSPPPPGGGPPGKPLHYLPEEMPPPQNFDETGVYFELRHNLFRFLVVLLVSLTLKINNRWEQAEKDKLDAELSYLKAQINPHFLFNTLNSIYSLAIEKSDYTASAVVMLSGMMRYVISEAHHDYVSMEKELTYIGNYIELQKIRLGNTVRLAYRISGTTGGKQIAPLILIPFVENAFKHGVNPEQDSDIKISIDITEYDMHLQVTNHKVAVRQNKEARSGLGIENTKDRLQLIYRDKHILAIRNNEKEYSVSLFINLK